MRWTRNRSRSVVPTSRSTHARAIRPNLEELEGRFNPSVVTATQSGLWSAAATWGGLAPPGAADTALIGSGINVTLNANPTVAGVTIDTDQSSHGRRKSGHGGRHAADPHHAAAKLGGHHIAEAILQIVEQQSHW